MHRPCCSRSWCSCLPGSSWWGCKDRLSLRVSHLTSSFLIVLLSPPHAQLALNILLLHVLCFALSFFLISWSSCVFGITGEWSAFSWSSSLKAEVFTSLDRHIETRADTGSFWKEENEGYVAILLIILESRGCVSWCAISAACQDSSPSAWLWCLEINGIGYSSVLLCLC